MRRFLMTAALLVTHSIGLVLATKVGVSSAVGQENPGAGSYFDETQAVTLFAFDDVSIPFTQNLKLQMRSPERHPSNPVVRRGDAEDPPDAWAAQFYGSVIREGDMFRMWYVAAGNDRLDADVPRSSPWRVAYAESQDGIHWTKPNLGLVEYEGNRDNNLVLLEPRLGVVNVKVLFDPDDPDPDRRYKMCAHVWFPKNDVRRTLAPYASPDGLRWSLLVDATPTEFELPERDLVLPALHFEPAGGLYKWDGLFYASGQNAIVSSRAFHGRVVREFVSPDFVHWSQSSAIGFVRDAQHTLLGPGRSREGEQTHEGVSVWNRGNVLLGISGIWHGAKEWDGVTVDLGFVVSNDGIHFREPAHEYVFLRRGQDGEWDQGGVLQGQGFENIGTETLIYYGAWDPRNWQGSPPRGGVGVAVLERDRFAELVVDETTKGEGNYQLPEIVSGFMTAPVNISTTVAHRFYVNADGLSADAWLKIELLDHRAIPLPEYSGEDAATVTHSGFQTPIEWGGQHRISGLPDRIRFRVTWMGATNPGIRFSAIYIRGQ